MTRYANDRLIVGVALSLCGGLLATIFGLPEVGLFVAPWVVLILLGVSTHQMPQVTAHPSTGKDRLLVGDDAEVRVVLNANAIGIVTATPAPNGAFKLDDHKASTMAQVDTVSAAHPSEMAFTFEAVEWGTHELGRITLDVVSRFGLFRSAGSLHASGRIRVHPAPVQLQELLTPRQVRRISGVHRSRESARGIEYADLRPFAAGDAVRDINWRASARSEDLWVSQRHPDRATDVVLLVDSFVESGHNVREVFGLILNAAIALADNHLSATDRVGLIEFGGVIRWVAPGVGRVQLQRLADALLATGLFASAAEKQLPALSSRTLPPRSFVVVLTPLLDERFIDAVFTARGRGHDVTVIECLQTDDRGAAEPVKDDGATTRQLAEAIWDAERTQLRDRLADHGIAVTSWDGTEPLDVALGELVRRRRRGARTGGPA